MLEIFERIMGCIYTDKELYLKCIYSNKDKMFSGFIVGLEYKVIGCPSILEGGKVVYNIKDSDGYNWRIGLKNDSVKFKLIERDKEE